MRSLPHLTSTITLSLGLAFTLAPAAHLAAGTPTVVEIAQADWDQPTMSLVQALDEASAEARQARRAPLNITNEGPTKSSFVIGAANTAGRFGSYFTTDLFIVNPHPTGSARVNIFVLRHNTDNVATAPPARSVAVPAKGFYVAKDIMGQLGVSGGAVIMVSLDSAQSSGTSTSVHSFGYTSTPGPSGGRYGVNIHGVGVYFSDDLFDGWTVGANVNDQSRTNLGVFNYSTTSTLTVKADAFTSPTGAKVGTLGFTVPRASFVQVSLSDFVPAIQDGLVKFYDGSTEYVGYMVVNDNITNDANFQLAASW